MSALFENESGDEARIAKQMVMLDHSMMPLRGSGC